MQIGGVLFKIAVNGAARQIVQDLVVVIQKIGKGERLAAGKRLKAQAQRLFAALGQVAGNAYQALSLGLRGADAF